MADSLQFPDYGEGVCVNCGFLWQTRATVFNDAVRGDGEFPGDQRAMGRLPSTNKLRCFRGVPIEGELLLRELENADAPEDERLHFALLHVLRKERECESFYTWVPGFGPRWHYNAWREEMLEEERRANALALARLQTSVTESIERVSRDHLDFVQITERQSSWYNMAFLWLAGIATLLALAALVVPLVLPNGVTDLADRGGSTPIQQSIPDTAESQP